MTTVRAEAEADSRRLAPGTHRGLSRGGEQTCHTSRDRRNAQQFLSGVAFVLAATPGRGRVSDWRSTCGRSVRGAGNGEQDVLETQRAFPQQQ